MTKKKIKEGIYYVTRTDSKGKTYEPKNPYETYRIVIKNGRPSKEWKSFDSVKEAVLFHAKPVENKSNSEMTLRDVWKIFEETKLPSLEVSSQNKIRSYLIHLEPVMDAPALAQWTPFTVDKLISTWKLPENLESMRCTRVSFKNELSLLGQLLGLYRSRFNFNFGFPILREHKKNSSFGNKREKVKKDMEVRDFGKFLTELKKITDDTEYESIRVMAEVQYGLYGRIQEIAAIHYEDFDHRSGLITLNKKIVWHRFKGQEPILRNGLKASDMKTIRSPHVAGILQEWAMKRGIRSGPLFFHEGKPMPYRAIQHRYDRAFKASGLKHSGTHILRHASLTEHYQTCKNIYETMSAAGHSNVSTTQKYAKNRDTKLAETQSLMDAKLVSVGKQEVV